jgi:rhodanese-related sulfurtransferase
MNHPTLSRLLLVAVIALAAVGFAACGSPAAPAKTAAQSAPVAEVAAAAPVESPQEIAPQAYDTQFLQSGAAHQLIDVRTPEEFAGGHIAGAVNIPVQEIAGRLGEVAQDQPVVLYCRSGNRSAQAAQILDQAGYAPVYDLGGIGAWQQAGYPVE